MVPAGSCFCPKCGHISTELFYNSGSKKTGVFLRRGLFGRGWAVEPYDPTPGANPTEKIKLLKRYPDKSTGAIDSIDVSFAGTTVTMTRSCPKCRQDFKSLASSYGMYPVFVVGTVGDRNAGKSSWYGSIAYPVNVAAVNDEKYPYRLDFLNRSTSKERDENTPENSLGNTKVLRVINKKQNKVVADVLMVDVSGEMYRRQEADNQYVKIILAPHDEYPGADGFVFLEPADKPRDAGITSEDLKCSPEMIFNSCCSQNLFDGKPVTYIGSRLDKILESRRFPTVMDDSQSVRVPLFDQNTFSGTTSYRLEEVKSRMAKEHTITSTMAPFALISKDKYNARGFIVQSCKDETTIDKANPARIYEHTMNVMDPLLWLLNQMKIFPLE